MVEENLLVDQFFELVRVKAVQFKIKIERTDKFRAWFILFEVQGFEVWVPKSILYTNTFLWIKRKHLAN